MKCPTCGNEFESTNPRRLYCSDKCANKYRDEKKKLHARERRAATPPRTCPVCGKQFIPKTHNQLSCSPECARKRNVDRTKQRNKRVIKICQCCGKEFIPTPGHERHQKYCSNKCNKKAIRLRARGNYVVPTQICIHCGKEFTPSILSRNQKFCTPQCRKEHARPCKTATNSEPTKSLSDWKREARDCNLDYGTYRALIAQGKTYEQLLADKNTRHVTIHQRAERNHSREIWL